MPGENEAMIAEMWQIEQAKTLEERRANYQCGQFNYITPESVPNWEQYATRYKFKSKNPKYAINSELNKIIALFQGNITALEVDAIQNAANKSLLGGGGIDGAIHRAAGNELVAETMLLNGCETGETKISRGYKLPAKYVLHTVGPIGVKPDLLKSCYRTTLELAKKHQIRSVALCGVSTGVYGYPVEQACPLVLKTVRKWLLENENYLSFDKIIFVQFADREMSVYTSQLPIFFPVIISANKGEDLAPPTGDIPPPPPSATLGKSIVPSSIENVETEEKKEVEVPAGDSIESKSENKEEAPEECRSDANAEDQKEGIEKASEDNVKNAETEEKKEEVEEKKEEEAPEKEGSSGEGIDSEGKEGSTENKDKETVNEAEKSETIVTENVTNSASL